MTLWIAFLPLLDGRLAIVDAERMPEFAGFAWRANKAGYIHRGTGAGIKLHKQIVKSEIVDHVNGDRLNNLSINLRPCTSRQNSLNRGKQKPPATSQYKGVSVHRPSGSWRAYITINRKQIHLGLFNDEAEAAKAYDKKAVEEFGEFARPNFPGRH